MTPALAHHRYDHPGGRDHDRRDHHDRHDDDRDWNDEDDDRDHERNRRGHHHHPVAQAAEPTAFLLAGAGLAGAIVLKRKLSQP